MLTAAAFMLAYSSGCFLAIFRHPIFGLVTYVAILYIHPPVRWWGDIVPSLRWSLIAAIVTLVAVFLNPPAKPAKPLAKHGLFVGSLIFVFWLYLQYFWALDTTMHLELMVLTSKYVLLLVLIYWCVDSPAHLKYFFWAHAGGCFYLGMVVIEQYLGGRFEGFEGPGIDEANAASLQIVTGVIVTFVLFLSGKILEKITSFIFMPFTLNALVATISRSGFLALGVSGILFNIFAPKKIRGLVRLLSIVGLGLFLSLTNPVYWERVSTILDAGEEIEGVNTGVGRVALIKAQFRMAADHPLGCGHRCTAVLSPRYLETRFLDLDVGARSSHNTFMSLLVEQGLPGAIFYCLLLFWIAKMTFRLKKTMQSNTGLLPNAYTATIAILGAITVGDVFVDYLKFETRVWFLGILMVIDNLHVKGEMNDMKIAGKKT